MPLDLTLAALFATQKTYWGVFLCALITTLLLTPLVIRLAHFFQIVDRPNPRKVHPQAKPLLGGLAIFCGLWIPILAVFGLRNLVTASLVTQHYQIWVMFLAGLAMLMQGFLDDWRGLNATWKFSIQFPVAIAVVCAGVHFENLTVPGVGTVPLGDWGPAITVLWLVGMTNALNLVDGIDGLATGVAFFACATNAVISAVNGNQWLAVTMCAMAGACLGFLRYNFSPARIFLGDTGSQFIGMTLAVISTQSNTKGPLAASMLLPMVILGYPLVDTMLAIARRKVRGKPVFSSDREHIHHRLLSLGLNHRRASLVLYGVCMLFSALAIALTLQNNSIALVLAVLLASLLSWGTFRLGYFHLLSSQELTAERLRFQAAHQLSALIRTRLLLSHTRAEVVEQLRQAAQEFGAAALVLAWKPGITLFKAEYIRGSHAALEPVPDRRSTLHLPIPELEEHLSFGGGELDVHLYFAAGHPLSQDLLIEYKSQLTEIFHAAWVRLREIDRPEAGVSAPAAIPSVAAGKTVSDETRVAPEAGAKRSYPTPHLEGQIVNN